MLSLAAILVPHHVPILGEVIVANRASIQLHLLMHQHVALDVAGLVHNLVAVLNFAFVVGVDFLAQGVLYFNLLDQIFRNFSEGFVHRLVVSAVWHRLLGLKWLGVVCSLWGQLRELTDLDDLVKEAEVKSHLLIFSLL